LLISAGFSGSLVEDLRIGTIVVPEVVIDAATGTPYRCEPCAQGQRQGVLVTDVDVAGKHAKAGLAHKFHASIVDMEAAGVARVAKEKGIAFCCVKSISDELGFSMPPLGRFVQQGEFHTLAFLRWVALRPAYWGRTIVLGRNSARASRALSDWLAHRLIPQFQQAELLH
jgi:adenosylhomocysteine nucleosidase